MRNDRSVFNEISTCLDVQSIGAKVGFVRREIWSYELQTLEGLLRDPNTRLRDKQATEIAQAIIKKIGYPEAVTPGRELEFLMPSTSRSASILKRCGSSANAARTSFTTPARTPPARKILVRF